MLMKRSSLLIVLTAALVARATAQQLVFDFEDGTTQGWVHVLEDTTLPHVFTPTNEPSENNTAFPVPAGGDFQMVPIEFENADGTNTRDGAHQTLLVRSPEFHLVSGDLAVSIAGGDAHGALPESPGALALSTDAEDGVKAQGFGLRRVSDDTYVATGARSTNDDLYQEVVLSAADLASFVSDTETYTVDVFDSSAGGWGWITFDEVKIPGTLPQEKLVYDFEDGTAQGWTVVSSDTTLPHVFLPTNEPSENGQAFPAPASGDYQMLPIVYEAEDGSNVRDGAHQTLLSRSPEFYLGSGDLSIAIVGGDAHGALPESPAALAETTDGEGVHAQGFGLRRVSDDTYVATGARSTNDDFYQEVVLSSEDLAEFVSETETYTVDVFDSSAGGWGWIGFDHVQIPGTLAAPAEIVFDFEDGSAQGWTNVSFDGDLPHAFTHTNEPSENGETFPTPASGDYQMLPIVFEAEDGSNVRDGAHQTLIARSPEFYLSEGDLSVSIVGGDAHGALPESPAALAETTDGEGVHAQGFGLRRVSDDVYVVTGARGTNDDFYQEVTIPATDLESFVSESETYTVDVFDSSAGGWGWIGFDNVKVPGTLVDSLPPVIPGLVDDDGDGMDDAWETRNGLNVGVNDAAEDPDNDGLTNLEEFQQKTLPTNADSDEDGLPDGVETKTGVYVSASDTGTHPLRQDTDADGLLDGVENPGAGYDPANPLTSPGTSPVSDDTDGDGAVDGLEVVGATNPTLAGPTPTNIQGGGAFETTHIWTGNSLAITDALVAEEVLDDPGDATAVTAGTSAIHFHDDEEPPIFKELSRPYPLWDNEEDGFGSRDNFVIRSTGQIFLTEGGLTTFVCNSSEGFVLSIDGELVDEAGNRGRDTSIIEVDLDAGLHDLELIHWESEGTAGITLAIYRGIGVAPDYAFTAEREPETNPREPFWELLTAFQEEPFAITAIARDEDGGLSLSWESETGAFYKIEKSIDLTTSSWITITGELDGAAEPAEETQAIVSVNDSEAQAHFRVRRVPPPPIIGMDFEEGLGDWTVDNNGIAAGTTWEIGVPADPPGGVSQVAGTDLDAAVADGLLNDTGTGISLRSPAVSTAGFNRMVLTFRHYLDNPNPEAAGGRLNFLNAADSSYIVAPGQEDLTFATSTDGWEEARIRVPQEVFEVDAFIVEWEFLSGPDDNPDDNGAGWFIDDVAIR